MEKLGETIGKIVDLVTPIGGTREKQGEREI